MSSFKCRPDRFLNKTELDELFKEFNDATNNGQATTATFSSLINSVREVYMTVVMETREDMLCQYKEHAKELAALRAEMQAERRSFPRFLPNISETALTCGNHAKLDLSKAAADRPRGTSPAVGMGPEEQISWPGHTFTLLIGSTELHYRRDMTDWGNMNVNGWTLRLDFKVFRYQEPGTVQVFVIESTDDHNKHRVIATMQEWSAVGWRTRMSFYAYGKPRPGTDVIWVGTRDDPERCIFVKGDTDLEIPGWKQKFLFWVPK